jgi:uncharacterized protein (DUF433 family)
MSDAIVRNPLIRFGKPTIKGTRITVGDVEDAIISGCSVSDIAREYRITKSQVIAAMHYSIQQYHGRRRAR